MGDAMPLRSMETLQSWLTEFITQGHPEVRALKVLSQDVDDDGEVGLVRVQLANASTVTYLEPAAPGSVQWIVTLEPREDVVVLDAAGLQKLSGELATVAALCFFLQAKSEEFLAAAH
ncbi:protein-L-isoaspartate carboxylmethyltransferase [Microbacterium sp. cx-55]|uniref:protein-L-isoaspartate carboxylmethyltransferase n=1 Tax=unclassified Microbacterium TaxID=2609290 RepID=UPI001CBDAC98|nr:MULTISPECIES: protein-L-isoaspartate carboxylmethyltransferase [unclassified Microbacterium]MBZ4487708.1 protein-L-isoaspartate carboxylmethyltransferase [Microbacterium sp. cx-55]MCC4908141.1 protein-L-isoaspartate carboxylmethyltransferase [Microbacterium sp. cx-59]UGB35719.1 protein-L-isoaspartate carboxylmethyltransferase [Microbacterium sp. cx-55]